MSPITAVWNRLADHQICEICDRAIDESNDSIVRDASGLAVHTSCYNERQELADELAHQYDEEDEDF